MALPKTGRSSDGTRSPCPAPGTEDMGYWDFRKSVCSREGWQLRRRRPQVYEVLDPEGRSVGTFHSRKGFFPV